jgi:hypothetical protein
MTFKLDAIQDIVKVVPPVIRRIMPTIILNEIVGVSPMMGPVMSIAELRSRAYDRLMAGTDEDRAEAAKMLT